MLRLDEVFKVPCGSFCVEKEVCDIDYDELDRPVLIINGGGGGTGDVRSVNGKRGRVELTTDDIPDGTNTKQLTNELRDKILDNETNITILDAEVGDNKRDITTNRNNITRIQTALQSKQDLIVGAASTAVEDNFTPDKIVITNAAGKFEASTKGKDALLPEGGVANQILVKNSGNDYDVHWIDATGVQGLVTAVNTKSGDVTLTQDDIGNGVTFVQTHNDYTDADKQIVNTIVNRLNQKVSKSGDTMTGSLTLAGAPTTDLMAATKKYVDDKVVAAGGIPAYTNQDGYKLLSVDKNGNSVMWRSVNELPDQEHDGLFKVLWTDGSGNASWKAVREVPEVGIGTEKTYLYTDENGQIYWKNLTELPTFSDRDNGKVLTISENTELIWKSPDAADARGILEAIPAFNYNLRVDNPWRIIEAMEAETLALYCDSENADGTKGGAATVFIKGENNNESMVMSFDNKAVKFQSYAGVVDAHNAGYEILFNFRNGVKGTPEGQAGILRAYNGIMTWNKFNLKPKNTLTTAYNMWAEVIALDDANLFGNSGVNIEDFCPSTDTYGHFTYGDLKIDTFGTIWVRYNGLFDPDGTKQLVNRDEAVGTITWTVRFNSTIV